MQAPFYNFGTIDVDGKPEVRFTCLKRLVGERGFEPPTPLLDSRCCFRMESREIGSCSAIPRFLWRAVGNEKVGLHKVLVPRIWMREFHFFLQKPVVWQPVKREKDVWDLCLRTLGEVPWPRAVHIEPITDENTKVGQDSVPHPAGRDQLYAGSFRAADIDFVIGFFARVNMFVVEAESLINLLWGSICEYLAQRSDDINLIRTSDERLLEMQVTVPPD